MFIVRYVAKPARELVIRQVERHSVGFPKINSLPNAVKTVHSVQPPKLGSGMSRIVGLVLILD
jgi:hypothetical protein